MTSEADLRGEISIITDNISGNTSSMLKKKLKWNKVSTDELQDLKNCKGDLKQQLQAKVDEQTKISHLLYIDDLRP